MWQYNNKKGATLLDVVVGTALLLVVFLALFGAFKLSLELVASTKARTGAVALGNEQMEFIRSLAYTDVGTVGGIPAGIVPQEESITLNAIPYTRRTFIQYIDDPADGLSGLDSNGITTDYKVARVELSWDIHGRERSFSLVTNIVPPSLESAVTGGILSINVFNSLGAAIPGAQVDITNTTLEPAIAISTFTNIDGVVSLLGAPAGSDYEISVSKSGYSSTQTYDVSGANPNPDPGHLTVTTSQTTTGSFAIDSVGSFTFRSFVFGTTTPLAAIAMTLEGTKIIGTDASNNPIPKYREDFSTGSSASVTLSSLEWDTYNLSLDGSATGYDIGEVCSSPLPLTLSPGESETVDVYLTPNVSHSVLVAVVDSSGTPLQGATTRLYRSGYDVTDTTSLCGQTFFGSGVGQGTISGGNTYSLDISLSGYTSQTVNSIEINGVAYVTVTLSAL